MRASLWLLALFGIAVALALFLGNNQGTVTLFWPPHRLDVSLNLAVLVLIGAFFALYVAMGALQALFAMPEKTRRWRALQRERAMHAALYEGVAEMLAGRFVRARRAAQTALQMERVLAASGEAVPHSAQLRAMSEWLAAESAHMLQDKAARDAHFEAALAPRGLGQTLREGVQLRAARWALDDRETHIALERLAALPQGVARRTLALRIKLKAARLAGQHAQAMETARLLAKHNAFSTSAAQSLLRALALEQLGSARDAAQLTRSVQQLVPAVRELPEVSLAAAQRWMTLSRLEGGADSGSNPQPYSQDMASQWLEAVWARYEELDPTQRSKLVQVLSQVLTQELGKQDATARSADTNPWLARLEKAQAQRPRDAALQYLTGLACMQRGLWGKAQQHLTQAAPQLGDTQQRRDAWRRLATLAQQRGDEAAAANAWKAAAQV
jgi:HemY protein